jgi:phospholipid/cholesterol/gamma-HCH transport system permease protein
MEFVDSHREGRQAQLALKGRWVAVNIADIQEQLATVDLQGLAALSIDAGLTEPLDLAGAWALEDYLRGVEAQGIAVDFKGGAPGTLRVVRQALAEDSSVHPGDSVAEPWANPVHIIGVNAVERVHHLASGLSFVGHVAVSTLRAFGSLRRLRPISIVRHVYDTGITALPIVSLIAFLITVIIAYLSATQLRNFGADIFVVDLITVGVLRELGVLLTAIIIAGRSGSAFAAEIGAMRLNEEVDALDATGVDAIETLIVPRVLGLVIAMPLLTVVADLIGLAGGALLCHSLLHMPIQQYINRAESAIAPTTFWVGIWKAPFFAVLIALAGTYRGLQVRGSSRELGRLTTVAVVQAIFLVLLADALFAVLFMEIDV